MCRERSVLFAPGRRAARPLPLALVLIAAACAQPPVQDAYPVATLDHSLHDSTPDQPVDGATGYPVVTEDPGDTTGDRPAVVGEFPPDATLVEYMQAVAQSGLVETDAVDASSAWALPGLDGGSYAIVGANLKEPQQHPNLEAEVAAVMWLTTPGEQSPYPPGVYAFIMQEGEGQSGEPLAQLLTPQGRRLTPVALEFQPRDMFGLGDEDNRFLYTLGSHRCVVCPWWLPSCVCYQCLFH